MGRRGGSGWLGAPTVRFEGGGTRGALYGCALAGGVAGEALCVGGEDRCVRVWGVRGRRAHLWTLRGHRGPVLDVAAAGPSGVASASADGSARVWDLEKGTCVKQMRGHGSGVNAVAVSGDGLCLGTAGDDGVCGVWDARVRRAVAALPHTSPGLGVGWSGAGRGVVPGALDNRVRLWDVRAVREASSSSSGGAGGRSRGLRARQVVPGRWRGMGGA